MFTLIHALALAAPDHLILVHTDVSAEVVADLAVVDVVQTFENPYATAIDATYVFPLPVDAAVRDMTVTCGERTIHSDLMTSKQASERYEAARAEGVRAALLEQQRSNVFTQKISGLCPGEVVAVTLQYVEPLRVDEGVHRFLFPTTMGARFAPGDLQEAPLVADEDPARGVSLRLSVHSGVAMDAIWSDSHPIVVVGEDDAGAEIELLEVQEVPNADLHIAWTLGVAEPTLRALSSVAQDGSRYVSLSLLPPEAIEASSDLRPRELVFVLDSSCSMAGAPWQAAVATVEEALDHLRPTERFNLVRFSDAAGKTFPEPVEASAANIAKARAWMAHFDGGGTHMEEGVLEALEMAGDPDALRMVLLLTDGYIGEEASIFRTVREKLSANDRIFSLGIGSSVNHLLLDGLAFHGRGLSSVLLEGSPVDEEVARFYRRIDQPLLTDITVDWGSLDAEGDGTVEPPDLFAGQPLHLVAKVHGADTGWVTVRGRYDGKELVQRVAVDLRETERHEAVETLWGRRRIDALERDLDRSDEARDAALTKVALAHGLVSRLTSLVAVDDGVGACGAAEGVDVPLVVPRGQQAYGGMGALGGTMGSVGSGKGGGGFGVAGTSGVLGTLGQGSGAFGKGSASEARVTVEPVEPTLVDPVVRRSVNALRYCYQRRLTVDPTLAGIVKLRFVIEADGTVSTSSILESTVGDTAVDTCLVGRFHRMAFPVAAAGVREITLRFDTED